VRSSFNPIFSRNFSRSLDFNNDSISPETTIGKEISSLNKCPLCFTRSRFEVAAIAEHNANIFSFLLIFL